MRLNVTKLLGYADCRAIAFMCNKSNALCPGSMLEYIFFTPDFLYSVSIFSTHIEKNQSVGGAKTGVSQEKRSDTPASRTWLVPHDPCSQRGANPQR